MQFTINKADFLKVLTGAQGVAPRRATMPILTKVLIEAKTDEVFVSSTDLEIYYRGQTAADVSQIGGCTVSPGPLCAFLKKLPDTELNVFTGEGKYYDELIVSYGDSVYSFTAGPADKFPTPPNIEFGTLRTLDSRTLKEMIAKTLFSTSKDIMHHHLSGLCLEQGVGPLRVVATNGHALTFIEREANHKLFSLPLRILKNGTIEMQRISWINP